MLKSFFALPLFLVINWGLLAQSSDNYQGLLWKISGNGLEQPSYLYGTMHVSNRVAFHLSETFFKALESAEIIALETNPESWITDLTETDLFKDLYAMSYESSAQYYPIYKSFLMPEPKQAELAYHLAQEQEMLNGLLWRFNQGQQDFEENTFLDLFIYQAGKKAGKIIVALEDFEDSFISVMEAGKPDKDATVISNRQARSLLGEFTTWQELQEDAYRKGDLDKIDTLTTLLYPGKYYRKNMLDVRNEIMARGMDSLMQRKILFTGVGAAHLPGKKGVINLLRKMGYTVEPQEGSITTQSIEEKEAIDQLIYRHPRQEFRSPDGFIRTTVPGKMVQVVTDPYQEYLFADMANSAYYSIKRINTFAPLYDKNIEAYKIKLDSLLFENIPGKIVSNKPVQVSGYNGLEIKNITKKGDEQCYKIIFTPLEIIIAKVGGHKEFVRSEQARIFMEELMLNTDSSSRNTYSPHFGSFEVELPVKHRIERYEGAYYNPFGTFRVQALDENSDYYTLAYRQFYDFSYLEDDEFELRYIAEQFEEGKKLKLDTFYILPGHDHPASYFELTNRTEQKLYGEVHLEGPRYAMLLTDSEDPQKRKSYFESFTFTDHTYPDEFKEYTDSVLFVKMKVPKKLNDYSSVLEAAYGNHNNDNKSTHWQKTHSKLFIYEPTGEQLKIGYLKFNKYRSFKNSDALWDNFLDEYFKNSLVLDKREVESTEECDSTYFKQIVRFHFSDTNTNRIIKLKAVAENGMLYYAIANTDTGRISELVEQAILSFDASGDTLIGNSVLHSKADLLFSDLQSGDSLQVYSAKNSITLVDYRSGDSQKIIDIVENYRHPDFKRNNRMQLLNRLATIGKPSDIEYLKKLYYRSLDSSAYQFAILETLADYETKKGNKEFLRLILDETPFSSNSYEYYNLINELEDSIEIVDAVFPELLELTVFEDYRKTMYQLLQKAVDSGIVSGKDYKERYSTILRFAKVELKKQKASEENSTNRVANNSLSKYVSLLRPFAKKKEVKELYRHLLKIKNRAVLLDQIELIGDIIPVPDSLYSYLAYYDRGLVDLYTYLLKQKNTGLLPDKYNNQEALCLSMAQNMNYETYDTISFISKRSVTTKKGRGEAFFYRAQKSSDNLWRLVYVVVPAPGQDSTLHYRKWLISEGESFNPQYDDMEEIIDDVLKKIEVYGRKRVASSNEVYDPGY